MERKSTELTNISDNISRAQSAEPALEETSKEDRLADGGKTGEALPDSVRERKVKSKEIGKKRVGSEAVVNDNIERRALFYSAFDRASFTAPDYMFFVCKSVVA